MKCLDCQYDLSAISSGKCPECGRAFDRNDSSTFFTWQPMPITQVLHRVMCVGFASICGSFLLHMCAGYAALFAARIELGHWPHRMGRDDPKDINWLVKTLYWIWILAGGMTIWLMLICAPFVLCTALKLFLARKRGMPRERRVKLVILIATAITYVVMILNMKFDPAQIGVWMMD